MNGWKKGTKFIVSVMKLENWNQGIGRARSLWNSAESSSLPLPSYWLLLALLDIPWTATASIQSLPVSSHGCLYIVPPSVYQFSLFIRKVIILDWSHPNDLNLIYYLCVIFFCGGAQLNTQQSTLWSSKNMSFPHAKYIQTIPTFSKVLTFQHQL